MCRQVDDMTIRVLLGCLSVALVAALDPKVEITRTEPETFVDTTRSQQLVMRSLRDQDVTLSCFVEDMAPEQTARWRLMSPDGSTQKYISTDMAISDNTKYSIEKPTDYTWRLRIKDIQAHDEGEYECYVRLTSLGISKDQRYVHVLVPPYLNPSMTSPDTTINEGRDITLMCNASGRPTPTIEWTRLGGALLPIGKEHHLGDSLPITRIQPVDRGHYQCHVWNLVGEIYRNIHLDVRFDPEVTVESAVVHQKVGYGAELTCYVEANPTPSSNEMKWTKDGLSYTVSSGRYIVRTLVGAFNRLAYELIIDGVEEEDYGTFSCQMSNSMSEGPPTTKKIRLVESDEPVNSPKVGRPVAKGEWRLRFEDQIAGSAVTSVSIATICMCLLAVLLQH